MGVKERNARLRVPFFIGERWHAYGDIGVAIKDVKNVIEKHCECYVAYPLGIQGAVVGQGDTYEEAISDVKSAIAFRVELLLPCLRKHR